jgi:hypothetical protein
MTMPDLAVTYDNRYDGQTCLAILKRMGYTIILKSVPRNSVYLVSRHGSGNLAHGSDTNYINGRPHLTPVPVVDATRFIERYEG